MDNVQCTRLSHSESNAVFNEDTSFDRHIKNKKRPGQTRLLAKKKEKEENIWRRKINILLLGEILKHEFGQGSKLKFVHFIHKI